MAAGSRVRSVYIRESTHGTTPSGTPKVWRTIGRNINLKKATLASEEIFAHGQRQDVRHGFNSVEASIPAELALNTQDDQLELAFGSTWASNVLKIGTNIYTETIERQFLDVPHYELFRGMSINQLDVRIQPQAIVGLTYSFIGLSDNGHSGTPLSASPTAAATNKPFDSFTGTISEGGSVVGLITGLNFTINRNRELSPVVGSKYSPDVYEGTAMVTGTITMHLQDWTFYDKFLNETESSVSVTLFDPDNSNLSMTFSLPRIKYTGNDKDPARTGPVIQNAPFEALYDYTTEQTSVKIVRDLTP